MILEGLGPKRLAAVNAKVRKLQTTQAEYLKTLIDADLEMDHLVATRLLSELAAPIREAFKDCSEDEIGQMVELARKKHRRRLAQ
jgi:hypothetical protein